MRRILTIMFSYLAISLILCLCFAMFWGNANIPQLLPGEKTQYVFFKGLLYFFRIIPAVLFSSFLMALSVYFRTDSEKAQLRFSPLIMGHFKTVIVVALIFVLILTFVSEVFAPIIKNKNDNSAKAPFLLGEYLSLGKECLEEENYTLARRYGVQALKINPENKDALMLIDKSDAVLKAIKPLPVPKDISATEYMPYKEAANETVISLIEKSLAAAKKENWFNSHYYAQLALTVGDKKDMNSEEAKRLAAIAWNKLLDTSPLGKSEDQILFAKKKNAYKSLAEGDNVDAYYKFLEIAAEDETWSSDPDVKQFLEVAESRVKKQCFFLDETDRIQIFENFMNVYFSVKHNDGSTDVVYIHGITPVIDSGRMIEYLRDFVVYSFSKEGRFLKSVKVPYAKMISYSVSSFSDKKIEELGIGKEIKQVPYIMLESIDRNFRGKYNKPVYEYSDLIPINERSEDNFIILPISTDEFNSLCDASVGVNYMNINSLIKIGHKAKDFGYSNEIFSSACIRKITYPFVMLILFVFIASIAWNFRVSSEQLFKFIWLLIFPICVFLMDIIIQTIFSILNLFNYFLIATTGDFALMTSIAILVIVLVIVSVLFMSKKSSE
ncbi:MAG: hypothetical protein J6J11_04860 [Treponema sp.]|nr:hypothetical protein [Treponema sp.]